MAHANTVFSQLLRLVSRHEFQSLAKQHHQGQALRKINRWDQFVSLIMAQFVELHRILSQFSRIFAY